MFLQTIFSAFALHLLNKNLKQMLFPDCSLNEIKKLVTNIKLNTVL